MVKNLSRINQKMQKCKPSYKWDDVMMLGGLLTFRTPSKMTAVTWDRGRVPMCQQAFLLSCKCCLAAFTVPPSLWNFSLEANICCIHVDSSVF